MIRNADFERQMNPKLNNEDKNARNSNNNSSNAPDSLNREQSEPRISQMRKSR